MCCLQTKSAPKSFELYECISNSTFPKFGAILATTLEDASIAYTQAHTKNNTSPLCLDASFESAIVICTKM